jgi:hypothetical protein
MGILISGDVGLDIDDKLSVNQTAALPGDGWIVSGFVDDKIVVTQRFAADGSRIGDPILVAGAADGARTFNLVYPILTRADGSWLQSYGWSEEIDGKRTDFFGVAGFASDGSKIVDFTRQVNHSDRLYALDSGGFLVVNERTTGGYEYATVASLFDATGEFVADIDLGNNEFSNRLKIETLANGYWSVFVRPEDEAGTSYLFDDSGTLINSVAGVENGKILFDPDGSYDISYTIRDYDVQETRKYIEHYTIDGSLTGTTDLPTISFQQNYMSEQITTLANGNTVLLWWEYVPVTGSFLSMQVLDADGSLIVEDRQMLGVNDGDGYLLELADGGWVVFGLSEMLVFNADGTRHGSVMPTFGYRPFVQATDDGGWSILYDAATEVDSSEPRVVTLHPNDLNNAPFALYSRVGADEDTPYNFSPYENYNVFQTYEPDGDKITKVVIESLPQTGEMTFRGVAVEAGQVVDIDSLKDLVWAPPENISGDGIASFLFRAIDEHGNVSSNVATMELNIRERNDAPWGADATITILEDEVLTLDRSNLPYFDLDNNSFELVKLDHAGNNGELRVSNNIVHGEKTANLDSDTIEYRPEANESGVNHTTIRYSVADTTDIHDDNNWEGAFHTLTINVVARNDAPVGHDVSGWVQPGKTMHLADYKFAFDDLEGDRFKSIVIDKLPEVGILRLNGKAVRSGDEIAANRIDDVTYVVTKAEAKTGRTEFTFLLRDDGGTDNSGDDLSNQSSAYDIFIVPKMGVFQGSDRPDVLKGTMGRDVIEGGEGNDRLTGLGGRDTLIGGPGSDIFVFGKKFGYDIIADFNADHDRIDLRGTDFKNFAQVAAEIEGDKYGVFIGWDYDTKGRHFYESIYLPGVDRADLTARDFIL